MNNKILFTGLLLLASQAQAFTAFKVRELSLELGRYTGEASRDVYLNTPTTGALYAQTNLNWDVDLICAYRGDVCWFWNNKIHSKTGQSRSVQANHEQQLCELCGIRSGLDTYTYCPSDETDVQQ